MKMKKYILGILLAVVCLSLITPSVAFAKSKCRWNNNKMVEQGTYACKRTGRSAFGRVVKCTGAGWVLQRGWSICDAEIHRPPTTLNEPVANPIPNTTQYNFAPYPFLPTGTYGTNQSVLPVNDPVTVGNKNLSNYVQNSQGTYTTFNNPVEINPDNIVLAPINFGTGVSNSIDWPPTSIFSNLGFWNKPFAYTFQKYVNDSTVGKWYPLNFFSVPDPTKNITFIPVEIKWAPVPTSLAGVTQYKFNLDLLNSLVLSDTASWTPFSKFVPKTSPLNHQFLGRAMATYSWSATPTDANNVEVKGDALMGSGGPYWVKVATAQNQTEFSVPNPHAPTLINPIIIGRTYFTGKNYSFGGGFLPLGDGTYFRTGPQEFLEWNEIPGAVKYQMQWAFAPMSTSLAFVSSFPANCNNCGNFTTDLDLNRPGFQYKFGLTIPQGNSNGGNGTNADGSPAGVYWRVQGCSNTTGACIPVRQSYVQSGYVMPPAPITPYQSAHLTWPKVGNATSYIVDIAENVSDFVKFPYLNSAEIPITKYTSTAIKGGMGGITTTPPPLTTTEIEALQDPRVFLLRRVVPNLNYNNHEVTVSYFKKLLETERVYQGDVNESNGLYDEGRYHVDLGYGPNYKNTFEQEFSDATPADLAVLDNYYPLISLDLSMTIKSKKEKSSLLINQLELTNSTPITIIDRSNGKGRIMITQTNGKKITVLKFTTKTCSPACSSGEYAFDIIKNITPAVDPDNTAYVVYPLTYARFGPMPLIENLNGKSYAEFKRLLPATTYFWRIRGIKEPINPASPFTWYPWSTTNSFTTPTGVSALVSVGSSTKFQGEVYELEITPALVPESKSTSVSVQGFKNLTWTGTTTGTTYNLTVYRTADRTGTPFLIKTGLTSTSFIVPGLIRGKTYYYELTAKNAFGTSPRGAVYSFKAEAEGTAR